MLDGDKCPGENKTGKRCREFQGGGRMAAISSRMASWRNDLQPDTCWKWESELRGAWGGGNDKRKAREPREECVRESNRWGGQMCDGGRGMGCRSCSYLRIWLSLIERWEAITGSEQRSNIIWLIFQKDCFSRWVANKLAWKQEHCRKAKTLVVMVEVMRYG